MTDTEEAKKEMERFHGELNDLLQYDGSRPIMSGDLNFIESVAGQVKAGRGMTRKQGEVISKIWDRYCGGK